MKNELKNKIVSLLVVATVSLALAACQPPEPEPEPEPAPPPEPSPEQYYQQLKGAVGVLLIPDTPAPPDEMIQSAITQVQGNRNRLVVSENGQKAIQMLTSEVDTAIRSAKEGERWKKVKALCMVYAALQPGNTKHAKAMEEATTMMNRPRITVTGFVELDGELYAFMDLFDPKTGETASYRRREGEEFHEVMRIVRIIGNQQAVEVEYLPARYVWTVPGPRERTRSAAS